MADAQFSLRWGTARVQTEDGALVRLTFMGSGSGTAGADDDIRDEPFPAVKSWLENYVGGREPAALPPLKIRGSAFERLVWSFTLSIPYGAFTTYGAIAAALAAHTGRRSSARAVGRALGKNPVWIMIPCHRVVSADRALTGYAGGLELKAALLEHEGVDLKARPFTPYFVPLPEIGSQLL